MSSFIKRTLENGLRVLIHQDPSTEIVAVNVMYDVGASDEDPNRTGFAHLFEHLMFGGSKNVPNYDEPLQKVGAENNAFTSNDLTNYYVTIPKPNMEVAFWLESDRMLELDFSQQSLDVQKSVVIEEFNQRYLNQPYGDAWMHLRPLAYKTHSYQWPTIGKKTEHIAEASLEEVKAFFYKHYCPANAVLVVAGDVKAEEVFIMVEKWFGDIPNREAYVRELPQEPEQLEKREKTVEADVPADAIYMAWKMPKRSESDYYATDLLSDILGRGESSRLYSSLVNEQHIFTELSAFITGERDNGLLLITGKPSNEVSLEQAEEAIWEEIKKLQNEGIQSRELEKALNKVESSLLLSEMSVLNKAINLAYHELLWGAEESDKEIDKYQAVKVEDVMRAANKLTENRVSILNYKAK